MFQEDTYDPETIDRELGWAEIIGFNTLRVYLHDLLGADDRKAFIKRYDDFLGIADRHGMKVITVLFDDCHRTSPESGPQPLPVSGVHNSGWMRSPGQGIVNGFIGGNEHETERVRGGIRRGG
jgi:hypothetical protein